MNPTKIICVYIADGLSPQFLKPLFAYSSCSLTPLLLSLIIILAAISIIIIIITYL